MITTWRAWHVRSHAWGSLPSSDRRVPFEQLALWRGNDRPSSRDRSRLCSLSCAAMRWGNAERLPQRSKGDHQVTGAELRAMRERAGVGLREMAQAIGKDRGHLSRVERGERDATPALVAAYQAALEAGTLEDMRRRSMLTAGAALPVLALTSGAASTRVGEAEVAAVRSLALDTDMSHPLGLDAAETALQRAAGMLHARVSPAVTQDLHEAVALLADRVGWGRFEERRGAESVLMFAHRTAQRGQDAALHAHTLLDLAVTTPSAQTAVATLEHALAGTVRGSERANLHAVAARRAATYDKRLAGEHLARALDVEPTPVGSEWAARTVDTTGHLDAIVGFACYAVGHPEAKQRLTRAVAELAPSRQRTRARCHIRLAGLALDVGDDDEAKTQVQQAISLRRSTTVAADLQTFAHQAWAAGRHELARMVAKG